MAHRLTIIKDGSGYSPADNHGNIYQRPDSEGFCYKDTRNGFTTCDRLKWTELEAVTQAWATIDAIAALQATGAAGWAFDPYEWHPAHSAG